MEEHLGARGSEEPFVRHDTYHDTIVCSSIDGLFDVERRDNALWQPSDDCGELAEFVVRQTALGGSEPQFIEEVVERHPGPPFDPAASASSDTVFRLDE